MVLQCGLYKPERFGSSRTFVQMPCVKNHGEFCPTFCMELVAVQHWIGVINVWRCHNADQPCNITSKVIWRDPRLGGQGIGFRCIVVVVI